MNLAGYALAAALAVPAAAPAQTAAGHSEKHAAPGARAVGQAEGEVRKVDREAKKLTIRHGPVAGLDMPAMTMVFQVSDPALLERVKPGERVRFEVEKRGGAYLVTAIEPRK